MEVEVDQREAGAQPMVVLCQAPVARFVEAEDAFQDSKRMFYLGPHSDLLLFLYRCNSSTRSLYLVLL